MVGDVDKEVKMWEEVGHNEKDGDICNDELPLKGAAAEGEPKRLLSVGEDTRAVGSYQMCVGAWTTTTVNYGPWEEGSAGTCVNEEADTCEGIKHKENIGGDRGHHRGRQPHNTFFDQAHGFSHFLAAGPKLVC